MSIDDFTSWVGAAFSGALQYVLSIQMNMGDVASLASAIFAGIALLIRHSPSGLPFDVKIA